MSKETNNQICNILYQLLVNRNLAATDQLTVSSGYLVYSIRHKPWLQGADIIGYHLFGAGAKNQLGFYGAINYRHQSTTTMIRNRI